MKKQEKFLKQEQFLNALMDNKWEDAYKNSAKNIESEMRKAAKKALDEGKYTYSFKLKH